MPFRKLNYSIMSKKNEMKTETDKTSGDVIPEKKEVVLNVLRTLCSGNKQDPNSWPKTRDVADGCYDSVYVTRYWLGLLEKEGRVRKTSAEGSKVGRGHSLRWCPLTGEISRINNAEG